jgi:hypothetical protein
MLCGMKILANFELLKRENTEGYPDWHKKIF